MTKTKIMLGVFPDDFVFENCAPELGTVITKSMKAFEDLVQRVASCSRARRQCRRQTGVPAVPVKHDVRAPPRRRARSRQSWRINY